MEQIVALLAVLVVSGGGLICCAEEVCAEFGLQRQTWRVPVVMVLILVGLFCLWAANWVIMDIVLYDAGAPPRSSASHALLGSVVLTVFARIGRQLYLSVR